MMQIGTTERQIIEAIKRSKHIKIVVDYGFLSLPFSAESSDIKKLTHDIALAVQDYYIKLK